MSCREPIAGTHDEFIKAHWKQTLGSQIHCIAGDALAILVAAIILSFYSLSSTSEAIIEYVAAYLFGLLVFQALFMRNMFSTYKEAVLKSIFPETVSMNFVMAGMLPTIAIIKSRIPEASDPSSLYFWAMMSLATFVGFVFSYPVNSWMVEKKIKHGMMTKGGI